MAERVWTQPALSDLDTIADYIALDNPPAAAALVQRVFHPVGQLDEHPNSGTVIPELENPHYRQLIEPPCRVFYRHDGDQIFILHIMRSTQLLVWMTS